MVEIDRRLSGGETLEGVDQSAHLPQDSWSWKEQIGNSVDAEQRIFFLKKIALGNLASTLGIVFLWFSRAACLSFERCREDTIVPTDCWLKGLLS